MKTKLLLLVFLLASTSIFALTATQDPIDYSGFFVSITSLLVVIPIVTEFIKTNLGVTGLGTQILSWVIGLILAGVGYAFNLGMFAEMSILETVLTGAGISLVSNGVADTGIVEWLLSLLKKKST